MTQFSRRGTPQKLLTPKVLNLLENAGLVLVMVHYLRETSDPETDQRFAGVAEDVQVRAPFFCSTRHRDGRNDTK